jgi:hypothetical protein
MQRSRRHHHLILSLRTLLTGKTQRVHQPRWLIPTNQHTDRSRILFHILLRRLHILPRGHNNLHHTRTHILRNPRQWSIIPQEVHRCRRPRLHSQHSRTDMLHTLQNTPSLLPSLAQDPYTTHRLNMLPLLRRHGRLIQESAGILMNVPQIRHMENL